MIAVTRNTNVMIFFVVDLSYAGFSGRANAQRDGLSESG
jgi:hypothetical protein